MTPAFTGEKKDALRNIQLNPRALKGTIPAIPSKSDAHRLMICAALADKPTRLKLSFLSKDMEATLDCLQALGAEVTRDEKGILITPIGRVAENPLLDCQESGSTFRFMLPVAAALCEQVSFVGAGRLPQRPIGDLTAAMKAHGVTFTTEQLPFMCLGKMQGGIFEIPGNVSSQYITGLLLALPLAETDSRIVLTSKLESSAYIDITLSALRRFGIEVEVLETGYRVPGNQTFRSPGELPVEGDWSNSAFFLSAGAIGEPVTVTGLDRNSPQGDKKILEILQRFGAVLTYKEDSITVSPGPLRGCTIDIGEIPDLLPILSVVAACASGTTRFINGRRLRLKESDRLQSTAAMIQSLGGTCKELEEGLVITGGSLKGGTVDSFHDHRIAMSAAIASIRCEGPVTIEDADAAEKSYPTFYVDFICMGGHANVI
ncbi:MAG: 3-phosphoshikimate 1-carboxyvinyltransferase [Firmicutes bacterium]|nr:3-phosphoshikimate 1-carboxyvinyltransferase [Clostridiales bacterium]MBQ9932073.1 3-phosphoshikimate 1-carboxyvinyltransferase [Bacillota bacterium]